MYLLVLPRVCSLTKYYLAPYIRLHDIYAMYATHTMTHINTLISIPFPWYHPPKCLQDWFRSLARKTQRTPLKKKREGLKTPARKKWSLGGIDGIDVLRSKGYFILTA